ncbi:unnamed protein product [Linum trigynum]|uniref:Fe2OG dioxygenase domain-containing protein n=1 Tax=Linum trigynum TaxID=586398 RepID=A0AAV2GFK8_9ROSI
MRSRRTQTKAEVSDTKGFTFPSNRLLLFLELSRVIRVIEMYWFLPLLLCGSLLATHLRQQRRDALKANKLPPPPPQQQFPKLEDDLMVEILVRSFPDPRSAGRCKLVCKRWRNLIAGTRFKHRFASRHQFLLARGILSIPRNNITAGENQTSRCWAELISWEPRAFIYHNFLSKTECEHLISRAKPHMVRSKLISLDTLTSIESSKRTSTQAPVGSSNVVRDIEKRIADFTFIPVENGERLTVVHYEVGQKLEPHFDYTGPHDYYTKTGGARAASILMYLSDVEEGGETVFPFAKPIDYSSKEKKRKRLGLSVKPKMGDALVFWNIKPDGNVDPYSEHAGSAVIKGDKWLALNFMRVKKRKVQNG